MNNELEKIARELLITKLAMLPEGHVNLFKRMYAKAGITTIPIETVVDEMPADRLDWAMEQAERSLEKLKR